MANTFGIRYFNDQQHTDYDPIWLSLDVPLLALDPHTRPAKVTKWRRHAARPLSDASGPAGAQLERRLEGPSS
jgi:hypothetical protein